MQPIALVTQSETSLMDKDIDIWDATQDAGYCCSCAFVFYSGYKLSTTAISAALFPICCVGEGIATMVHANYAKRIMQKREACGWRIAEKEGEHMEKSRGFCCARHCLCYEMWCGVTSEPLCESCRDCDCLFNDNQPCGRNSACCGGDEPQATATSGQSPFYVNSMQADTPMVLMPIMLKS